MSDNQGPIILVCVWLLTGLSFLFLLLRIHCKRLAHRGLWWDDHVLIASWISLLVSVSLVTVEIHYGSGKHIWEVPVENLGFLGLTGNIVGTFSILAATLSKTSFAVTLLRLLQGRWLWLVCFIIITMNIAMSLNALFLWVRCSPVAKTWNVYMPGTCWPDQVEPIYGMFAAGYSAAMDFVLALIPWKIIWKLQMKRKEKVGVALAMSMGVFAGATAIMKTVEIPSLASGDFTYNVSGLTIWGSAESAVTIMAASTPFLRTIFRDLNRKISSRRYYVSETGGSQRPSKVTPSQKAATAITTIEIRFEEQHKPDQSSNASILGQELSFCMEDTEADAEFATRSVSNGSRGSEDICHAV